MDLRIKGRRAIVCASSRGLGKACATALAREGCEVVINGLDEQRLQDTAAEIRKATGVKVTPVRADLNTDEGRNTLAAASPEADILINNNAGPPPGKFEDWGRAEWMAAIEANVNITSAMVKGPRFPDMGLSTSARTGLTGLSKSLSRAVAADNVTINNLLPERIDTDRQRFSPPAHRRFAARQTLRPARRVRRHLRFHLRRPGWFHDRTEHPTRLLRGLGLTIA
jgi:3-oxoacyl-[acyl-carrier protein] reductase